MKKLIALSISLCFYTVLVAQSAGDYRTVASGTWSSIAIWQRYNGTAWKAATTAPTYTDGVITIRDGHNVTVNTNITIDQATVDGGGQLSLTANVTITLNNGTGDDLTVNGLFVMSTGVVTGTGNLVLNNQLQWSGGALQIKTANTGAMALEGGTCSLYDALTNSGTVTWEVGRLAFFGGSVVNNGVFTVYTNDYLNNQTGGGVFTNNATGVFNVNTLGTLYNQINFINKGVINFNSGYFLNYGGTFTNSKTMNFSTGTFQNQGTTNLNSATKLTGNGTLLLYNTTLNVNAAVSVPASITLQLNNATNPLVTGTGSLSVSGPLLWGSGTISVPLTINNSGTMAIGYSNVTLTSALTNNGTINWNVGNIYFNGGTIVNNNAFNIISDYQFIKNPSGTFTNNASGVVMKSSFGTTTINIPFTNKGTIAGTGTFSFGTNLTNTGSFDPGVGAGTANLTVGTNYTNSTLLININGLSAGKDYDRVTVTGNATLKGTLTVTASDSLPEGADTILKTTGTITGKFATVNLPTGYTISYRTNKVIINIPLPALQNTSAPEDNITQAADLNKQFSVFPNPATQSLFINYPSKNKTAVVQIFDLNSNEVYRSTIETGNGVRLNIGRLVPGTYVLSLKDGDKTQTTKFIKQ
jgi:hypothetical protein